MRKGTPEADGDVKRSEIKSLDIKRRKGRYDTRGNGLPLPSAQKRSAKQWLTDNDSGRRDERSDEQTQHEDAHDDAEALDQVHVRDLDRLRRSHSENHRDSGSTVVQKSWLLFREP